METEKIIRVIMTSCPPSIEKEWNEWYNGVHMRKALTSKRVKKITRCKLLDAEEGAAGQYMAVYEFDNRKDFEAYRAEPQFEENHQDFLKNWTPKGAKLESRATYQVMKTWQH